MIIIEKYGGDTWDAGNGLCPHMSGQKNDFIMIKLQGTCNIETMTTDIHQKTSFWSVFDSHHEETMKKFKDNNNHEFHDEVISFGQWVEWYEKYK